MKDLLKVIVFGSIFLVPLLPVYVENNYFFPFITGKNFAFRIIVEVMFAAWLLLALLDEKYRPKFSYLLAGFGSVLVVMLFANLFGEYPLKSFWSNYERMDGYVTLVHVFLLLVVMGSVMLAEKWWKYFFMLSSAIALWVALYGIGQMLGWYDGWTGRLDSRLGNAAYMAVYMLFHIFIVAWLAVRSKQWMFVTAASLVGIIFAYALLLTATRGTFIGLVGGVTVTVAYFALFGRKYPEVRKFAVGGIFALVVLTLLFIGARDSAFIQNTPQLARIANIDIVADLETRGVIWSLAWEGVKERPLLGWGQGNFNYVFNQNFDPVLYNKEAWFDRVHNLVLDWLIAGGILGFLAYASIYVALAYYLLWLPYVRDDQRLDVMERAVLLGLIAGYLLHNMVVFDNIISYIFFACVLALIHFRVSEPIAAVQSYSANPQLVTQIATPVVAVLTIAVVYFANVPGMQASGDIIDAMRADTIRGRLAEFHEALGRGSFADQEIVEQLAQQAMGIARNPNIPAEERDLIIQRAELELLRMVEKKPGDARLHNFLATFYRTIGAAPQAQQQGAIARSLAPEKQAIILEQGITELQLGNTAGARDFFKEAFELETSNSQALILYAATEVQLGNVAEARELVGEEYFDAFALNDFALASVNQSGDQQFLADVMERRTELNPSSAQNWASLAFVYYQLGDSDRSIAVLEQAASSVPAFAPQAECFIDNITAGNEPAAGCNQ